MSDLSRITITVPPEMKRKLRILAAAHNMSLSELTLKLYDQVLITNPVSDPRRPLSI